jgi:hypothetical protein
MSRFCRGLLCVLLLCCAFGFAQGGDLSAIFNSEPLGATFECEACEIVLKEVVEIVKANKSISVTEFHREMDDSCERNFDPWLASYCMYELDPNALVLYEAIVKRGSTETACAEIGTTLIPFYHLRLLIFITGYCSKEEEQVLRYPKEAHQTLPPSKEKAVTNNWSFVVLSDIHVGDTARAGMLDQLAINKINNLIAKENIKFVIITGDITNSAMPQQWLHAKALLDQLKVRFIYLIML